MPTLKLGTAKDAPKKKKKATDNAMNKSITTISKDNVTAL